MKERTFNKEQINWWQRAFAAGLFVAGIDIIAGAGSLNAILLGVGALVGSKLVWDGSKKQVLVTT